jgi:hypothetical protein
MLNVTIPVPCQGNLNRICGLGRCMHVNIHTTTQMQQYYILYAYTVRLIGCLSGPAQAPMALADHIPRTVNQLES